MADDNAFAAAQLAAALIQAGKLTEKAHGNTVQDATRLYFECLDAVRAESKKRSAPSAPTPPTLEISHQRPSYGPGACSIPAA